MYSRKDDAVTLTMTVDEYEILLTALGYATMYAHRQSDRVLVKHYLALMNSLNQGHPHYTPYEVPES